MAGEGPDGDDDDDPCPLCGGPGPAAARVTLAKRRLFPVEAVTTTEALSSSSASALRESVARQRRAVAGLQADLDAERAAAADAANEAMSMILRLQRDKSEAMIEARQYRRYAEERFAHDAAEADALRAALGRSDATVRALSARLAECQARLLRLGYHLPSSSSPVPAGSAIHDHHHRTFAPSSPSSDDEDDCPSVPCLLDHHHSTSPAADVGTPRTHHLLNRMPDHDSLLLSNDSLLSNDTFSYDAMALADDYPLYTIPDRDAPDQDDDRVYTVDAVHGVPAPSAEEEEEAAEIQKLKARLQALEADRESMRHAILSMGDEKAQVVLLREVAQQLCKEGAMFPAVPMKVQPRLQPVVVAQRKLVKRRPCFVKVFIITVIKWITSVFCWRRKSNRIRHPIGLCGSTVGLMLVLDRYPKQRCRRFIKRI